MKLKLKDLKTGLEAWSNMDANLFWWSEGNGSCDCNRALEFPEHIDDEMEEQFGNYCYGCVRFVAIDIDGDHESESKDVALAFINRGYPAPYGGIHAD